jgi:hypothetical protein
MSSIVITHPTEGIYLGNCMGLGFWSMLDSVGQTHACTFESEPQAREHVSSWDNNNDPDGYSYQAVATDKTYATIPQLIAAGLENLLGDMVGNMQMAGTA